MPKIFRRTLSVVVVALVSGCPVHVEYRGISELRFVGYPVRSPLLLAVVDRREDAANDDTWVGVTRGRFGNPHPVTTASGRPLATDLGESIAAALSRDAPGVHQELVKMHSEDGAARKRVTPPQGTIGVLVILRQWQTDQWGNSTTLSYDVAMELVDSGGTVVGRAAQKGEQGVYSDLDATALGIPVSSIIEQLFDSNDVRRVLAPLAHPP